MMLFINAGTTRGAVIPWLLMLQNNTGAPAVLQVLRSILSLCLSMAATMPSRENRLSGWQGSTLAGRGYSPWRMLLSNRRIVLDPCRKRRLQARLQGDNDTACIIMAHPPSSIVSHSSILPVLYTCLCSKHPHAGQTRARITFFVDFLLLSSRLWQTSTILPVSEVNLHSLIGHQKIRVLLRYDIVLLVSK
jgi:hypothetical protein